MYHISVLWRIAHLQLLSASTDVHPSLLWAFDVAVVVAFQFILTYVARGS